MKDQYAYKLRIWKHMNFIRYHQWIIIAWISDILIFVIAHDSKLICTIILYIITLFIINIMKLILKS